MEPADPINPGETKTIRAIATDAVWETERLTMAYDPENRFAGLLMFFDTEGGRRIIAVGGGPVIPKLWRSVNLKTLGSVQARFSPLI